VPTGAEQPRLLETIGHLEVWLVDGVMHVLPALRDDMPADLKNALSRRRRASLTGRCDCGARTVVHGGRRLRDLQPGEVVRGSMAHERDCTASDAGIAELVERFGGVS
jgi:hypothetical protein